VSGSQNIRPLSLVLARLRRAKILFCGVANALRAFATPQNKTGERRRRSPGIVMGIRHV